MNEEEKKAIEYLKTRLYGNKGCKYIDVAQEDLRIFIKLVDSLQKENEKLKADNLEYQRIQDISDVRPYRKRYLEERRKEENDLLYPDADEIYERYYKIKEENEKLKNKDTNKVSLEIGKSKTIKKIYVSDKQIGLGILTNWTGRKLDFLFANKINELVQAVNQLSKKTEE